MKKLLLMALLSMMALGAKAYVVYFTYYNDTFADSDLSVTVMYFAGNVTSNGTSIDTSNALFLEMLPANGYARYDGGEGYLPEDFLSTIFGVDKYADVQSVPLSVVILDTPYPSSYDPYTSKLYSFPDAVDLSTYSGQYVIDHGETTKTEIEFWGENEGLLYFTINSDNITWENATGTSGVPEPSTGLLFLAGAGLLMKRRKNA